MESDAKMRADKAKKGEKKRPRLRDVLRSYRLVRYVKPYRGWLVLMFAIIFLYAGCHFASVALVRELLEEGLWLPPAPPPTMSIDKAIEELPEGFRAEARSVVPKELARALDGELSRKQVKRIGQSAISEATKQLEKAEAKGRPFEPFEPIIKPLTDELGGRSGSGALRKTYWWMSQRIGERLKGQLSEADGNRFGKITKRAFGPTEEQAVNRGRIALLCGGLAAVAVLVGLSVYYRTRVKAKIVARATFDIRQDLCKHLLSLDMKFFGSRQSGEMISRQTNDIVAGTKALVALFDELAVQPFLALAYAAAAFYVSWHLSLAFCILLLALPYPMMRIARRIKKYGRQKLERIADLMNEMTEIYHGIRVTKAFRIEERKLEEFSGANERYVDRLFRGMKMRGLNNAVTETFVDVCVAAVMFFASFLVTTGLFGVRLEPPDVLTFAGCMMLLYRPVKAFTKAYPEFMESVVASERVFEILDLRPDVKDAADAVVLPRITRSVAFRDVSFRYGEPLVLEHISFEARRGEVVAVVGHSGAGKSTLLDLIPRFHDPESGRVEVDGVDIRVATLASLRGQIAVVSQDPFLFYGSIRNNIRYGRLDATDEEIEAAAKAANIHEFIAGMPDGYETMCGERGVKLSGGQRQRITIARAILKDAPILILDEATSSLDIESERLVQDALNRLMEHRTTFVIAHRLSTVQHADRIVVLRDGRLMEIGTHDELIQKQGEYWRLYKTQFEVAGGG